MPILYREARVCRLYRRAERPSNRELYIWMDRDQKSVILHFLRAGIIAS